MADNFEQELHPRRRHHLLVWLADQLPRHEVRPEVLGVGESAVLA